MNLFLVYQEKILKSLKILERKKIIKLPPKFKNFTVELPPKNQKADMSCNVAMILAKFNNSSPLKIADIIKQNLLVKFKEFKTIDIAEPGFLNIYFQNTFWEKYLLQVIKLNARFGINVSKKNFVLSDVWFVLSCWG